jgi:hypothetical protein
MKELLSFRPTLQSAPCTFPATGGSGPLGPLDAVGSLMKEERLLFADVALDINTKIVSLEMQLIELIPGSFKEQY